MANAKPILYGVSDFVLMRTEGAYYIDRTAYIRELEKTRYVMFLRPRRFGKSLLVSLLYYFGLLRSVDAGSTLTVLSCLI